MPFNCPTCKKIIEWNAKFPHRPFCSMRCKQLDFGDWASERFQISGESLSGQLENDMLADPAKNSAN